jgi:hypothetical protein
MGTHRPTGYRFGSQVSRTRARFCKTRALGSRPEVSETESAKARQDATLQTSRFVGRLEKALEHYERLGSDDGVAAEVASLRARVGDVEAEVRESDYRRERTSLSGECPV